jgi:hypothetical protein
MLKNEIELKKYHSKKFCKEKKIIKRIIKEKNVVGKKIMEGEISK